VNEALGTRCGVMQAPIGGAAGHELYRAVAAAGGLAAIPASWMEPAALRREIADLRRATDAPFAVNLVLHFEQAERVALCAEEGVPVVTFSWGAPGRFLPQLHAAGCRVFVQVGSVAEGLEAGAAGADALIAQGVEAGGHVESTTPLADLVAGLCRATDLPVIAAGGIADAASARAARDAGAAAVAAGTRFVASRESTALPVWQDALVAASADDTVLTGLFDIGWPAAPHRVLRNSTYRMWEAAGSPPPGARPGEGDILGTYLGDPLLRYSVESPGPGVEADDFEPLCLYAGESVGLIHEVLPAAEIVALLA
jgi:NAD(P)H-dependent flavin oxidoreductase YrpB (nitropropane dioxygenase family)